MANTRRLVLLLCGVGAAGAAIIVACSDDAKPTTVVDAGEDGGVSGSDSAAEPSDAGQDVAVDGAGRVSCGAAGDCDRGGGLYCCVIPDAGAPTYACAPDRVNACPSGGDRLCDERSDCQNGAACCAELDSGVVSTLCFFGDRCAGDGVRYEVCKPNIDGECPVGKTCKSVSCPGQGSMYLCDVPPGCQ